MIQIKNQFSVGTSLPNHTFRLLLMLALTCNISSANHLILRRKNLETREEKVGLPKSEFTALSSLAFTNNEHERYRSSMTLFLQKHQDNKLLPRVFDSCLSGLAQSGNSIHTQSQLFNYDYLSDISKLKPTSFSEAPIRPSSITATIIRALAYQALFLLKPSVIKERQKLESIILDNMTEQTSTFKQSYYT